MYLAFSPLSLVTPIKTDLFPLDFGGLPLKKATLKMLCNGRCFLLERKTGQFSWTRCNSRPDIRSPRSLGSGDTASYLGVWVIRGASNMAKVDPFFICNLFSLLLKLPQLIKIGTDLQFCFFCRVTIALLIVVIENQYQNRMIK